VVIAGDWAFAWSKLRVEISSPEGSRQSTRAGHTLTVFRREDGRWRLARDANLLVPVANEC
jgi:ketosteroid isomerase-like protein